MRVLLLAAVAALLVASSQGLTRRRKTVPPRPRSPLSSSSRWRDTLEDQELGHEVCDGCAPGTKPQHPLAGVVSSRTSAGLKIAGGSSMYYIQDAPWMALITMDNTWSCGGSLISETYVLTSAQCASGYDQFMVGLGDTSSYYHYSSSYVYSYTYKSIVHEQYEEDNLKNDIGLIELLFPVTFTDKVRPIKLPSSADVSETFVGQQATVLGWGAMSDSGSLAYDLRYVEQPVMETKRCVRFFYEYVTKNNICTDGEGGVGTCESDGGDPLTIQGDDGVWKVIGVSSFQSDLGCTYGYPSVFTRVTQYLKWISSKTDIQV